VAERTGGADAGQLANLVDVALNSHDRIEPQQFDGHGRIGEIDLAPAKRDDEPRGQCLDIHLETKSQRVGWGDGGNDLVHPQHVGPELLVAKGVVAEDGLAT
jgi:hypothetical protein